MSPTRSPAAISSAPPKPTRAALARAAGKGIPDVIAPELRVLFCGINPGLYSAATGYHFARPGNRFWPALHAAGFTPRTLQPFEQRELLAAGLGVTNLVNRATASAEELTPAEFLAGRRRLALKVRRYRPEAIAFLGVGAFGHAFGLKRVKIGLQPERFEGAAVWVLPNPSGLNANYQLPELVKLLRPLWHATRISTAMRRTTRQSRC